MRILVLSFLLSGCAFLNHPQYCHTHDDCLNGQYCPTIRSASNPPDICKGKAVIDHKILAD